MKTFETEKHNIPEGATHTHEHRFYMLNGDKWSFWNKHIEEWCGVIDNSPSYNAFAIPQQEVKMNIDKLATQVEEAEWVNGDDCIFTNRDNVKIKCKIVGLLPPCVETYVLHCPRNQPALFAANVARIEKPESPEEKEKRERLDAAYDLYCEFTNANKEDATCMSAYGFEMSSVQYKWLVIVDKTGYRLND